MNNVRILDCTLRDGGYINEFAFGESIIKGIIRNLSKASVDIIECGFLKSGAFDKNCTLFGSTEAARDMIVEKNPNLLYVGMIQYGNISNEEISVCSEKTVDGIRITFHEHEIEPSFVLGKQLMDKGYKVFMQPVGTTSYTDAALLNLIEKVNALMPYGFYMVDTLGAMYKNDILRMFYLVDNNLDKRIHIGFHSHNNLQLSFANAQELLRLDTTRSLIVDASVFGMGRGAGNLNTELIAQYINSNIGLKYDIIPILETLDEYIKPLSFQYRWGYDAAYFISSAMRCHPNYASYLLNLQTLHVQDIYALLSGMSEEKRTLFNKDYISQEYIRYMSRMCDDSEEVEQLRNFIGGKEVVLLAPGKSLKRNAETVRKYTNENDCVVVSVNFLPDEIPINVLFVSNMKRFSSIKEASEAGNGNHLTVITSNISFEDTVGNVIRVNYSSYLNEENCIVDNAGLMCINLLKKIGIKKITMAGFDGFSSNLKDNFVDDSMIMDVESDRLNMMNVATSKKLHQLRTQIDISSLTTSIY